MAQAVNNPPAMQETQVRSLDQKDPLEKGIATQSTMPGEFHGQRILADYSPWGRKGLDTTKGLTLSHYFYHGLQ